jgi:hypothetical protein
VDAADGEPVQPPVLNDGIAYAHGLADDLGQGSRREPRLVKHASQRGPNLGQARDALGAGAVDGQGVHTARSALRGPARQEERSACWQEEHGHESGAALLNVTHKPPPPPPGLLGTITAHQRERNREGGFGAAPTEHEREKHAAEERQNPVSSGNDGGEDDTDGSPSVALVASTEDLKARTSRRLEEPPNGLARSMQM